MERGRNRPKRKPGEEADKNHLKRQKAQGSSSTGGSKGTEAASGQDDILEELNSLNPRDNLDKKLYTLLSKVVTGGVPSYLGDPGARKGEGKKGRLQNIEKNSTIVYKMLDIVSYLLEDGRRKTNVLKLLEYLQNCNVLTSKEIISVIDANKLDNISYSEGLIKIFIREKTKNNYVLKIYNLYRENQVGYSVLYKVFNDILKGEKKVEGELFEKICGYHKLCPNKVLYELVNYISVSEMSEDLEKNELVKILKSYPLKSIKYIVKLYLKYSKENEASNESVLINHKPSEDKGESKVNVVNKKALKLLSHLIVEGYLELNEVYGYLEPKDELISELSSHYLRLLNSGTKVILAGESGVNSLLTGHNNVSIATLVKVVTSYVFEYQKGGTKSVNNVMFEHLNKLDGNMKKNCMALLSHIINKVNKGEKEKEELKEVYQVLLKIDNLNYVKNNLGLMEVGKITLLANLLRECKDFSGPKWELCYSLIVHFYNLNFPIFLSNELVHSVTTIMERILEKSEFYEEFHNRNVSRIGDLVEEKRGRGEEVNLKRELAILNKVEYYFNLVGFKSNVRILALNELLNYLYVALLWVKKRGEEQSSKIKKKIVKLLNKYVLYNVMNCNESNFQLGNKMWYVLSLLTVVERYEVYSKVLKRLNYPEVLEEEDLRKKGFSDSENEKEGEGKKERTVDLEEMKRFYYRVGMRQTVVVYASYNKKLKNIFKKITYELLKQNKNAKIRRIISIITAISVVNPFNICQLIVRQSEMFNNLLLPLCELFKYFTNYTIDFFIFFLYHNLNENVNNYLKSKGREQAVIANNGSLENIININSIILYKIYKRHTNSNINVVMTFIALVINNYISDGKIKVREVRDNEMRSGKKELKDNVVEETAEINLKLIIVIYNILNYVSKLYEIIHNLYDQEPNKLTYEQLLTQSGSVLLKSESYNLTNYNNVMGILNNINSGNVSAKDRDSEDYNNIYKLIDNNINKIINTNSGSVNGNLVNKPYVIYNMFMVLNKLKNELLYDIEFNNIKLLLSIVDKVDTILNLTIKYLYFYNNSDLDLKEDGETNFGNGGSSRENEVVKVMRNTLPNRKLLFKYVKGDDMRYNMYNYENYYEIFTTQSGKEKRGRTEVEGFQKVKNSVLNEEFVEFVNKLNIYDIYIPEQQYNLYTTKLTSILNYLEEIIKNLSLVNPNSSKLSLIESKATILKNKLKVLSENKKRQLEHIEKIKNQIKGIKLVKNESNIGQVITVNLVKLVVYPRVFLNELNSLFCCKLIDLLLEINLSYFNYFDFINCFVKLLLPLIVSLTENELNYFIIFFNYVFHFVKTLLNDKDYYNKVTELNPCFCSTFKYQPNKQFTYEQLIQLIKKSEYNILLFVFSIYLPTTSKTTSNTSNTNASNTNNNANNSKDVSNNTNTNNNNSSTSKDVTGTNTNDDKEDKNSTNNNDELKDECNTDNNSNKTNNKDNSGSNNKEYKENNEKKEDKDNERKDKEEREEEGVNAEKNKLISYIEIKNIIIFLNKINNNFPITLNSSNKLLNFLKNVLKLSKLNNWEDINLSTNTLINLIHMYQNQNKYISL